MQENPLRSVLYGVIFLVICSDGLITLINEPDEELIRNVDTTWRLEKKF